jgi:hypothetical protein
MGNWTVAVVLARGSSSPLTLGCAGAPAGPVKKAQIRQVVGGLNNPRDRRGLA